MFDISKIEINAAFYELYESVFEEDFFGVLTKIRPSGRVQSLRMKASKIAEDKVEEDLSKLSEEELKEYTDWKIDAGIKAKKYTSRIAYIGSLLFRKKYNGSLEDYYMWLSSFDASVFNDTETQNAIWGMITKDQKIPKSAKNA